MSTVVRPTLAEMRDRGAAFSGVLYVGLALTSKGPRVIEFNARFGDPEIQVVLPTMSTPLGGLLWAAATGRLDQHGPLAWRDGAAVGVVVAASGYPQAPRTGDVILGANADGVLQAGTAIGADGALVSAGGRVLCCTATGADLAEARARAYALVDQIRMDGSHHRTDIALAAAEGRISL
jgi:phosphoribosylamine--glycine ligase